ncbi:SAM-dependent methyltransferase [Amycolatopsis saalfeldensis]|uniref:Methyltransferase domain-containing protein n=1 Tax=Amycolatopsis saalfeldensis TaxID=394193 RepID=A0A1H8YD70_9PSEU|nr:class I SAM-dependent methyltransferase [Amycolatopsis saalfeldensis]SEP50200.1 Methyltransferase domain-containing protein [Amycolatopsis saalfeldensis]
MTEQMPVFDRGFWEELYGSQTSLWTGRPNPQLVTEAADLRPRRALDAGCGEGGDALWLAASGWHVTAVDFSATALARGAKETAAQGLDERISWLRADLTSWAPEEQFDLVSAQFMHLPTPERTALFERLAAAVAPGGTLLIVGHHPSDLEQGVPRPQVPDLFFTAESIAETLDDGWDAVVTDARPRTAALPDGHEVTVRDAVLVARRRG